MDMKEVKRNAGREGSKEKVTAEQQQFWLHFARSAVQSHNEEALRRSKYICNTKNNGLRASMPEAWAPLPHEYAMFLRTVLKEGSALIENEKGGSLCRRGPGNRE